MPATSWQLHVILLISVAVNSSAAIFVPKAGPPSSSVKRNADLDWVDQQDLFDYNERDGSLWSDLLEQWTLRNISSSGSSSREGRVLQPNHRFIPTSGFYVTPVTKRLGVAAELEPHMRPPAGKVIAQQFQSAQREISETDLYLLGAIEKLVFRVDTLEQRLRRTEQLVYYMMQGNNPKDENYCPQNFTQVAKRCYHFGSSRQVNWQSANNLCKAMGGHLAEFEEKVELKQVTKYLLEASEKGNDFWLAGLNPGLLWIWSNSARPIEAQDRNLTVSTAQAKKDGVVQKVKREDSAKQLIEPPTYEEIKGSGRCLKLSYNAKKGRYQYRGDDCSARSNYLCEFEDKQVENEINRTSKSTESSSSSP